MTVMTSKFLLNCGRLALLLISLISIPVSAGAVDRIIIDFNRDPKLLLYDAVQKYSFDYGVNKKSIRNPIQVFQSRNDDSSRALMILAYNKNLNDDAPASIALFDYARLVHIDEDPLYVTIKDYCIYYDTKLEQKCVAAVCYRNDSAFVLRNIPGTGKLDYIYLTSGVDHSGNGEWEPDISFIAALDYDYDGREEIFFYVCPGRDREPRILYCLEMEDLKIEWSLPVASVMGRGNLYSCGDSSNPAVIFTTYGPQNGVFDSNFDDRYGYITKVDSHGAVLFNKIILGL